MKKSLTALLLPAVILLATAQITKAETAQAELRPLARGCVSATDYLEILKLVTRETLSLPDLKGDVEAGYLVGLMVERNEVKPLETALSDAHSDVLINPDCVVSETGVVHKGTGKKMALVTVCVSSIAPPHAAVQVTIEKSTRAEDVRKLEFEPVKTRAGWLLTLNESPAAR